MPSILQDYLPIIIFMSLCMFITLLLIIPPLLIAPKNPDPEKLSPYECGFEPFDDARSKFDIRFYLVAILFIIFGLEVAFLFPLAIVFWRYWSLWFFLYDVFFNNTHYWFHL